MQKISKADLVKMKPQVVHRFQAFPSLYLDREVVIDVFLPPNYDSLDQPCQLMFFNDGQQTVRMRMGEILENFHQNADHEPLVLVAIHAGPGRLQEYGTAAMADYAHRGNKAAAYTFFITQELLPFIEKNYKVGKEARYRAFTGFSLGGLSAFDIVWHHPNLFHKAGILSGSFWWRRKKFDDTYTEDDRIMHHLVPAGEHHPELKMWFSAGTDEEKEDRNNNGIIDIIDDILDLMTELKKLGYQDSQMKYLEVKGGKHNEESWSETMPEFLDWMYGK